MTYSGWELWVALSAVSGAGILAVLQTLARSMEHQKELHDLRVRAGELRLSYAARLKALRDREDLHAAGIAGSIRSQIAAEPARQAA